MPDKDIDVQTSFKIYPEFPFIETENYIKPYLSDIHIVEIKKNTVLDNLKNESKNPVDIEKETRDQANNSSWFSYRKNRFTASLCNKLGNSGPKTDRE